MKEYRVEMKSWRGDNPTDRMLEVEFLNAVANEGWRLLQVFLVPEENVFLRSREYYFERDMEQKVVNVSKRAEAMKWWNGLCSAEKTRICDTNHERLHSIRRWESLTGREIEILYRSRGE